MTIILHRLTHLIPVGVLATRYNKIIKLGMQKGFYYGHPSFLPDFFAPFLTEILVEEHYNNNMANVFIISGNISGGDS